MNCCDDYGDCRQGRDCPARRQVTRPTFTTAYALNRAILKDKRPRLLECLRIWYDLGVAGAVTAHESEFCVVDIATKQKGHFEWPQGMSAAEVEQMISGTFGARAYQTAEREWIV